MWVVVFLWEWQLPKHVWKQSLDLNQNQLGLIDLLKDEIPLVSLYHNIYSTPSIERKPHLWIQSNLQSQKHLSSPERKMAASDNHNRSNSLPSKPHPLIIQCNEHLSRLEVSAATTMVREHNSRNNIRVLIFLY